MPLAKVSCPRCRTALKPARPVTAGDRILCPKCKEVFSAREEGEPSRAVRPAPARAPAPRPPAARAVRRAGDDDDFSDLEEAPRRQPRGKKKNSAAPLALILGIAGGALALFLVVLIVVVAVLMSRRERPTVAADDPPPATFVAAPVVNDAAPAAAPPPPTPEPDPALGRAEKPRPPAPPDEGRPVKLDDWLQDLEAAKQQAAQERKDILIYFDASDWCPYCIRLNTRVFQSQAFQQKAAKEFVCVRVDSPRGRAARAKVQDEARNERLQRQFAVDGYPRVVLADDKALPYAFTGFQEGEAAQYLAHLDELRQLRAKRDELLAAVASERGPARLEAARAAFTFLAECEVIDHYGHLLEEWAKLAQADDPGNQRGGAEVFLLGAWARRIELAGREAGLLGDLVGEIDAWRKNNRVKEPDRLAGLYMKLGVRLALASDPERARQCFQAGLACKPADAELLGLLKRAAAGRLPLGSGTGFVVSAEGHLLTNHHVIAGPGRLVVELRGGAQPLPAEVVAEDKERDIALLRVELPAGARLQPLNVTGQKPPRLGESVLALGYPLGDALGSGIKLTRGVVSGLPETDTGKMAVLDVKVNPGNSGGPLLDAFGNVVGMVTAKTATGRGVDSYGLAAPSSELDSFLRKHLPSYRPPGVRAVPLTEPELNVRVLPGVVRVLKVL
jgi:S1-C subfamily serine protease